MNKLFVNLCVAGAGMVMLASCQSTANKENVMTTQPESITDYANYPTYDGEDLEMVADASGCKFRLWSPMADSVAVKIYENGVGGEALSSHGMVADKSNGTWSAELKGNYMGKFYAFQVMIDGRWLDETPGVWAKAVGVNGVRAAIIDMKDTNPDGWDMDKGPALAHNTDAVIYEMHHRDFSVHKNSGITNKGKFIAMLENGTLSLNGEKTGIDHLKELGVTHVHILPSYDYNSVDETQLPSNKYNWGYDPINYNVPEGSYSTNPACPVSRIKEMKMMIQALHKAGIGVILDVVYNHTGVTQGSNFELTAPGYYYRHREDGSFSDASGCGNETASDRQQMRSFMVNSVKYWMNEYHIDGFRFDLMAIHDIETMNAIAEAANAINPDVIIYGEGWTCSDSPLPVERRALKEHVSKMPGIAVFSDDIRDAVKGHYSNAADPGFASGKPGNEETVKLGIVGATAHPQIDFSKCNNSKFGYATHPVQVVNYVSCHDDLCLTDKLSKSMPGTTVEERVAVAKLAQTIVFTSQGIPFMFTGEEIFRDKKGVHNSYNSPDSINAIDWNQKKEYRDLFDYYKGIINIRKLHPAFRMTTAEDVAKNLVFDEVNEPNVISYSLKNNANGDSWNEIKVIFNGATKANVVEIPEGEWTIVVKDGKADEAGLGTTNGGKLEVAARTALILARVN